MEFDTGTRIVYAVIGLGVCLWAYRLARTSGRDPVAWALVVLVLPLGVVVLASHVRAERGLARRTPRDYSATVGGATARALAILLVAGFGVGAAWKLRGRQFRPAVRHQPFARYGADPRVTELMVDAVATGALPRLLADSFGERLSVDGRPLTGPDFHVAQSQFYPAARHIIFADGRFEWQSAAPRDVWVVTLVAEGVVLSPPGGRPGTVEAHVVVDDRTLEHSPDIGWYR